ncbi:hypothetical protein CBQ28_15505 [Pseudoalteromonas sp. GCY]|uniref:type I polyketide synthase n=1 Tax=Pseudoalteromonas sp. GCY TaxID=2003316 RepID=UPI000BFED05B|nr:type I polyketide synthase [Pseudoalteromonas sp. GCY]PHI36199.1 hypothetical protein CBQ28_15505 [Pseudoalteromonas sp. GCY]QQQ65444.1 acyltransferase domain-containing protein [Pseudoalteromonas sp. GCY]
MEQDFENDIAIISMAGRFPGAGGNLEKFWQNLREGVESVQFFDRDQLAAMGIDAHLLNNPKFVAADAVLDDIELFDAEFFNFSPREAEILDPQHRLFLEASWEAMERAGYTADKYDGKVGVYAGSAMSGYMVRNLKSNPGLIEQVGTFKTMLANDKDFLSTRVSYKMGFTGASVNVNTLCSSSAVAIHLACESLLNHQNDLCLAGGVSLQLTRNEAFFYQEGSIGSPDGHCRAFDEKAGGTVSGSGLGILILKRLEDAVADRDTILAVIKGTAINNDGADKASYTAPNPNGQAECIAEAYEVAGVNPSDVTYIEAHGTGTLLGDPIEIAGLTKAFRYHTEEKQFCAVGSVKTNIGHLVTAGGIASAIKTILALHHRQLPPSLNFDKPNPKIDFENSPFYVNDALQDWQSPNGPRTAGVSSFGIGGTNAHMVLQEFEQVTHSNTPSYSAYPIVLSAPNSTALFSIRQQLLQYVKANPQTSLKDLAFTLQIGRKDFAYRQSLVSTNLVQLEEQLEQAGDHEHYFVQSKSQVAMMFTGQGAQYSGMASDLYVEQPEFAKAIDLQCELLADKVEFDIKGLLLNASEDNDTLMTQTHIAQVALFVYEYAMSQLLMSWKIKPKALIGHSIGEFVAACLAGVFSLESALQLVAQRGKLMAAMAPGAMLSVNAPVDAINELLLPGVEVAAYNAPGLCVVTGTVENIDAMAADFATHNIQCRKLHTSHAFHSHMMAEAAESFMASVSKHSLNAPQITVIANLTGQKLTDEQAQSAKYWADQLRHSVMFNEGVNTLQELDEFCFVEIGPAAVLSTFVRSAGAERVVAMASGAKQREQGAKCFIEGIAALWRYGIAVDWNAVNEHVPARRIPLPTYPFNRKKYWIDEKRNYGGFAGDLSVASVEDFNSKVDPQREIAATNLSLDVDFSSVNGEVNTAAMARLVALREDIQALCQQASHDVGTEVKVSALNLNYKKQENLNEVSALARDTLNSRYRAPENELQRTLVKYWQQILGVERVGLDDNFFELGGHSLLAAALANNLRSEFDLQIPLDELLLNPTIAQLSELVELHRWNQAEVDSEAADVEEGEL